jgi:hypothetical protein
LKEVISALAIDSGRITGKQETTSYFLFADYPSTATVRWLRPNQRSDKVPAKFGLLIAFQHR